MQVILSPESWPAYINAGYLIPESWPAYAHSTPRWQSAFHRRVAFNLPAIATRRISPVRFQSNQTPSAPDKPCRGRHRRARGDVKKRDGRTAPCIARKTSGSQSDVASVLAARRSIKTLVMNVAVPTL